MARNSPVIIWIPKQTPSNDPKFHHAEILDGVGKSIREELKILRRGCVLRVFINSFYSDGPFLFFPEEHCDKQSC